MTENQPPTMPTDPAMPAEPTMPAENQAPAAGGELTKEDKATVRSAAMLAGALVSGAEPGFFDTLKESFAASGAVKSAPAELQQIMAQGGLPQMPESKGKEALEAEVVGKLGQAKQILAAKAPQLVDPYRAFVLQSARDVAEAAKGTSEVEAGVIAKVEQALA